MNAGAKGDYIFLLYKWEENIDGFNHGYITDFYIDNEYKESITYQGRTYYPVSFDGGSAFKNKKGDLNRGAGGDYIYMHLTTDTAKPADVNNDGEVGIGDIVAVTNVMAGLAGDGSPVATRADVNGDGDVGIGDIVAITNIMAGGNAKTYTVNGVSFTMVKVEGGTFLMGSTDGESDEQPVHSVTLSSFSIGLTEVTQQLWYAVMEQKPTTVEDRQWSTTYGLGDQYPAYWVSWDDIQAFITKLNQLTGQTFRLPTEAEWEFAARGGNSSKGYTYAGSNTIDDVAWYKGNSGSLGSSSPEYGSHVVASKQANELGLYDMSGNVWEWCQDAFGNYTSDAQTNPTGAEPGPRRVSRGGSWSSDATNCRVANRSRDLSGLRSYHMGFRLAQ